MSNTRDLPPLNALTTVPPTMTTLLLPYIVTPIGNMALPCADTLFFGVKVTGNESSGTTIPDRPSASASDVENSLTEVPSG